MCVLLEKKSWHHVQVDDEEYQLRPMNCPFHVLAFKQGFYSYRDLPIRWAELGTVYRYERSGTLHGLFRVRGFTQVCFWLAFLSLIAEF
jgi:threonyl-tRNA synthetase